MYKGTVVRWKDEKGFGFIRPDDGQGLVNDIFVYHRACDGFRPTENMLVTFTIGERDGRKCALEVRKDRSKEDAELRAGLSRVLGEA